MRWVPAAVVRPHRCAFLPQVAGRHPEGFFDFGTELFGEHAYCSVVAFRQMAQAAGWAPTGGVNPLAAKVTALEAEVHDLTMQRDALARQMDAVAVLRREGYQTARKPGRPPKAVA